MSQFSDYTENNILQTTLRGQAFPVPAGTYLALFLSDPTDAGSGTEASGGWYARQSIGLSSGWTAPADSAGGKMSQNVNQLAYNAVTGAQAVITHIGIYDAVSAGNLLYHAPLVASKTLEIGDVLQFAAGAITVTVK